MSEGQELLERILQRWPVADKFKQWVLDYVSTLEDEAARIGWALLWFHPDEPKTQARNPGLLNDPHTTSATCRWVKIRAFYLERIQSGGEDPDPFYIDRANHAAEILAFRAMIPRKYRMWREDPAKPDAPLEGETRNDWEKRRQRERSINRM